MRALIQRVTEANVTVDAEVVSEIQAGLLVFLGVSHEDTEEDARYLARKIATLRLFEDDEGKLNLSVQEQDGAILVVSQFTLYGDLRKGRRPSFTGAAKPEPAKELYEQFCIFLREAGIKVAQGVFQAYMQVSLVNDGPVTFWLDSAG